MSLSVALPEQKFVTDGILLREATLHDPLLSNYSVVILDETHERNLNTDTLLGLLKKIRRRRKDLRLIICSATIDAQRFLDFFVNASEDPTLAENASSIVKDVAPRKNRWGPKIDREEDQPPLPPPIPDNSHANRGTIISVDGRQYSVDVLYLQSAASNYLQATVDTCDKIHRHESMGDVLCFLPTGEDIDRCIQMAEDVFQGELGGVEFLPLYGTLPQHVQVRVFHPNTKRNVRRFIFATNIAETSVSSSSFTSARILVLTWLNLVLTIFLLPSFSSSR